MSNKIAIPVIHVKMMSLSTHFQLEINICTAGFLFELSTLENRTDRWYQKVDKQLPLTKLRGLSPRANYTDRAAAAGRLS
jgi:hypothetical protein